MAANGTFEAVTLLASRLVILAVALAIDRLFGDPDWLWRRIPHPVALMGRAVGLLDQRLNDARRDVETRRLFGVLGLAVLVLAAGAMGSAVHYVLGLLPFGTALEAIVVAVFLAERSLIDHVAAVERELVTGGLESGRHAVSKIVGRDVSLLDEAGVTRAAIESGAENFSDGVLAPTFWYLLLGLPGLLVFKLVNTADSMIGNRSPRHAAFGWAAARLDDLLNFVPARLSALLIAGACAVSGLDGRATIRGAMSDAPKHKSPNAGWPEAALASALGLALGGPRRYGDIEVDGAWLNPPGRREAGPQDIRDAIRLIDAAWSLLVVLVALAAVTCLAIAR